MKYHNTAFYLYKKITPNPTINYKSHIKVLSNPLDRDINELENKLNRLKNQTLMLNNLFKEKNLDSFSNRNITSPIRKIEYKKYNPYKIINQKQFKRTNIKTSPISICNKSYDSYNFENNIVNMNDDYYKIKCQNLRNHIRKKDKIISELQNLVKESINKLNDYKEKNIFLQNKIEKIENAFNDIRKNTCDIINDYQMNNNTFISYHKFNDKYPVNHYLKSDINHNKKNFVRNAFICKSNNDYNLNRLRSANAANIKHCYLNITKNRKNNRKNGLSQRNYVINKHKCFLNSSK